MVTPTPSFPGTFIIGDLNAVVGNHVTFWGAHWADENQFSDCDAPHGFKGYAGQTDPMVPECGGTFTGHLGGGTNPPMMIPHIITVAATSSVMQSHGNVSGTITSIVLVETDPGYEPHPGHAGTGTVIAVVCAPERPGEISNISTRLRVETGDNVLIGGLIINGTSPKNVLLRACGPSLPMSDGLADPILELRDSAGQMIASNDNWRDAANAQAIIETTIPPGNDLESAILMSLEPGAYTAVVRGAQDSTGIAVVEAYDLSRATDSKLQNISTRGFVRTGDNVLIGGMIVLGQDPMRVIIRAIGPSLPVAGSLTDPTLELRDGSGSVIATNDNWRSDQEAEITATGIAPTNDLESAIVQQVTPGQYTAIVRGANDAAGVALVEVYSTH